MLLSFIFFMCVFAAIGLWSARHSKGSTEDYLVASRHVPAWLTGLSAVATNNSGYMFVGMIGYTYSVGLSSIWLMIGWIAGDIMISQISYKKIRAAAEERKVLSFSGMLSGWQGKEHPRVHALAGIITVIFLAAYAAAQLKAGSKALHVLLGWDYSAGAIIGAVLVLAYCFAGGLRASIWTDAAQSFVMIIAMGLICFLAISTSGGVPLFTEQLDAVSPTYLNIFPTNEILGPVFGPILFVIGWIVAGFGVAGQPHIMVRFMSIDKVSSVNRARLYYYIWYTAFYALTIVAGLAARLMVEGGETFDMELALPLMAGQLLPAAGLGLVLAAMFAATMSTADSQILSCTAAMTQDVAPKLGRSLWSTKFVTVVVTVIALVIALSDSQSVFGLVLLAWSGLASAFVPLLLVQIFGGAPSERLSLAMMIAGLATSIIWQQLGLSGIMYEIAPGLAAGFMVYGVGRLVR